jgi:hypothetical protein
MALHKPVVAEAVAAVAIMAAITWVGVKDLVAAMVQMVGMRGGSPIAVVISIPAIETSVMIPG